MHMAQFGPGVAQPLLSRSPQAVLANLKITDTIALFYKAGQLYIETTMIDH